MSILNDYPFIEMTDFGGAWIFSDPSVVRRQGALLARNVDYAQGEVGLRKGFGATGLDTSWNKQAWEMHAWYGPFNAQGVGGYTDQLLVWIAPNDPTAPAGSRVYIGNMTAPTGGAVEMENLGGSGATGLVGASFVGDGMRLYASFYTSIQRELLSSPQGRVYCLTFTGSALTGTVIILFPGPYTYAMGGSEPSGGVVTVGTHYYGYLVEYISGFVTRASPDSGANGSKVPPIPPDVTTFNPFAFTSAGGNKVLLTCPGWGSVTGIPPPAGSFDHTKVVAISIIMTTGTNPSQFYIVPGSRTPVATAAASGILIDISDDELADTGTDATPYMYWLTQGTNNGIGPFYPSHISLWGDRMAYKAYVFDNQNNKVDAIYVSERNNYQQITADQHVIQLPGQRNIITMFHMGTVNYILGPHEIFSVTDNGDIPISWAPPHMVDGRHGTLAIHGVEVSPSGNYAWIVDQGGLFLFTGGPITELPISYEQTPDWNRINWEAAWSIKVRDDGANKRVYVLVPLDGAANPTHIMMWEYTAGTSWDRVRYSLQTIGGAYPVQSISLVRNDIPAAVVGNKKKVELWLGARTNQTMLRMKSEADASRYNDNGSAIDSVYRTSPFPGRDSGQSLIHTHHGFKLRITGAGTITPKIYDIDGLNSFTCRPLTLGPTPNADELFLADLNAEHAFLEIASNALSTNWNLVYVSWYYSPWLIQR
jgi:hypothetical protein